MASVLSISQLNKYVSFKLKSDIKLKGVAVKGEISNFSCHFKSGHMYFTLKDSQSQVKAVMFASCASKLKFVPEDGINVLAVGNIEVYERDGVYQIIVTELVPLGAGAINDNIEKLKQKLSDSGIIDEKNKKPIPLVPKKIAVVTSADAAALRDIINITGRRYPVCEIEVYPAVVQGVSAADSICSALLYADNSGADTIILTRGGGSVEDLMAFNTESVAMAVYNCKTPVVSAVGHETDTTVVDYVSDMRAPTPSAAAEICTPDKSDMLSAINLLEQRLNKAFELVIERKTARLYDKSSALKLLSPIEKLSKIEKRLERQRDHLSYSMNSIILRAENGFSKNFATLNALSPFGVLDRGYSIVTKNNRVVYDKKDISVGDCIEIRLKDSLVCADVTSINEIKE